MNIRCNFIRSYRPEPDLDLAEIDKAAELINTAKKPYVLIGQGVHLGNAEDEFKAFIEKGRNSCSLDYCLGLSPCQPNIHLNIGMLGMHGNYGPNIKHQ